MVPDRTRRSVERGGTWLLLVALGLGLLGKLMYFPIWTADRGLSMRILLSYVTVEPVWFILERLLPGAGIIGLAAIALIEAGHGRSRDVLGSRWNRERVAILSGIAAGAALIASVPIAGSYTGSGSDPWTLVRAALGLGLLASLGLYLVWTAERLNGTMARWLGTVALAFAIVSGVLQLLAYGDLSRAIGFGPYISPTLSVAAALTDASSMALWIGIYVGVLLRAPLLPAPTSVAIEG